MMERLRCASSPEKYLLSWGQIVRGRFSGAPDWRRRFARRSRRLPSAIYRGSTSVGSNAGAAEGAVRIGRTIQVFYDFHFKDKLKESGFTFVNHVTVYASSQYLPIHYDHGTGLAVADVDGDGLYDIYFVNQVGGNDCGRIWEAVSQEYYRGGWSRSHGSCQLGASFADVNNSGHPDLFVTTVLGAMSFFKNDGQRTLLQT